MIIIDENNIKKLTVKYSDQFYIEILTTKVEEIIEGIPCIWGQITIGDFQEKFPIALEDWTAQDYTKQWQEAFDRLETNNTSCLVAYVQDPLKAPFINWWPIFKRNNKIHVRNCIVFYHFYKKRIGNESFTHNNWYQFIPQRYIKKKCSEWIVDVKPESSNH